MMVSGTHQIKMKEGLQYQGMESQPTGGSHLSRIFWEHENLSGLSVIWLIQLLLLKDNSHSGI